MLLIFHAFAREVAPVRKRLTGRVRLPRPLNGYEARLDGRRIAMVATAMGSERARAAARDAVRMLARPQLVITCGVAGALSAQLRAGETLLADRILIGVSGGNAAMRAIEIDPRTLDLAALALHRAGLTWRTGGLLTAGRVLAGAADKQAAHGSTGALAVDMESGAIAEEIAAMGLPVLCLRTIMDEAHEEIPGAEVASPDGRVSPLKAAAFFLKHPGTAAQVPALMRNLSRASAALGRALEAICAALPEMEDDAGATSGKPAR